MLSLKPSKDVNKFSMTGALTLTKRLSKTKDEDDDEDDPQEEAAPLEARIRKTTIDMFKRVLLFSQGAAEALYNDQMITTLDVLRDLTNDIINKLCHAIRKPGGD